MFLFFLHLIFCFFLQPLDSQIARKYPRKQVGRDFKELEFHVLETVIVVYVDSYEQWTLQQATGLVTRKSFRPKSCRDMTQVSGVMTSRRLKRKPTR